MALAFLLRIHCQPPQQGDGQAWVAGQFFGKFYRQISRVDHRRRQGVVTQYPPGRRLEQHERRGDMPLRVLPCLKMQVAIQRIVSAGKAGTVMAFAMRFDHTGLGVPPVLPAGQSLPRLLTVGHCGAAQTGNRLSGFEQRCYKGNLFFARQADR